jgi:uncharacterized protein
MPLRLEFSGSPTVSADRAAVWRHLLDPHFVAASVPGLESVRILSPERFQIVAALRYGPMKVDLAVEVELSDLVEPERARLRASVDASGSTVTALSDVRLGAPSPDQTLLDWSATVEIDGMLAGLGSPFVDGIARKLTADFWTDFARRAEAAP